jgi:regulation of enolase protein 1 (concanavalin A-like superfamily)
MIATRRCFVRALAACLLAGTAVAHENKSQTIPGWGVVTNPDGDCTVKAERGKLTVTVPEGTHDLNAKLGGMKAPRILKEVEGDFTVQVKVTGEFNPGDKPANEGTSAFNGAGLLLWQDEKNYLRLERNAWWIAAANQTACYPPLVEYYQDGEYQETNPQATIEEFFKGRSTWLKVQRQGNKVTASYSHDDDQWTVAKEITVTLAKKLQVGVAVVNTAAKPCTVEFAEFKLTTK